MAWHARSTVIHANNHASHAEPRYAERCREAQARPKSFWCPRFATESHLAHSYIQATLAGVLRMEGGAGLLVAFLFRELLPRRREKSSARDVERLPAAPTPRCVYVVATLTPPRQRRKAMKYILMLNAPRGTGDWDIFKWPQQDIQAHVAYWDRLNQELRDAGELVSVEALAAPKEAKRVRADKSGLPVTDGVFPESKEFLAGYWIIDVESPERAYAIAAKASAAPGPGGKPLIIPLEVRQVMQAPTVDV
jgi:hypothetical protein